MLKGLFTIFIGSFLLVCLLSTQANAQEQPSPLKLADRHYFMGEYKLAAMIYEKDLEQNKKLEISRIEKLADCYAQINDFENAIKYYRMATAMSGAKNQDWLYFGDALKAKGNYQEAKIAYSHYSDNNLQSVKNRIAGCDSAEKWKTHPLNKIYNIKQLNSNLSDWGAVNYRNQAVLFVSDSLRYGVVDVDNRNKRSGRTNNSYHKIYSIDNLSNTNNSVYGFDKDVNYSSNHIGPIWFNRSFDTALITYTNFQSLKKIRQKVGEPGFHFNIYGTRRLTLYQAVMKNGKWNEPTPFQYNKENEYSVGHATVSPDGQKLYFASDRPEGYGKIDIWYCVKTADGNWGPPQNCGPMINTPDDDAFPFMDKNGNLYYASKGKIGMGGYDIYKTSFVNDKWMEPVNMRYPINSEGDDFSFYIPNDKESEGYFASNRDGGLGSDDIYGFILRPENTPIRKHVIKMIVKDDENNEPLPFSVIDVSESGKVTRLNGNSNGTSFYPIEEGSSCNITVQHNDYRKTMFPLSIAAPAEDTLAYELRLPRSLVNKNLVQGDLFEIKYLYYDFDKWDIRPDAALILDELNTLMTVKYPNLVIELSSHTDSRGPTEYNQKLSDKRAASAKQYLVDHGIKANRIISKGYGETHLKNRCKDGVECSEAEHQQNRRTEVKVLKLNG